MQTSLFIREHCRLRIQKNKPAGILADLFTHLDDLESNEITAVSKVNTSFDYLDPLQYYYIITYYHYGFQ